MTDTDACIVLTTAASETEAEAIATALVADQLAACINIFPIKSIYTWQDKLENSAEWQLVIKTKASCFTALCQKVSSIHSYDVPELISLPIEAGSTAYMAWLNSQVQTPNVS